MFEEMIKNPVIIALIVGTITYVYMSWNRKKQNEKRIKHGKKIKEENKYDDILIPSIVAVISWFIAFGYFNYKPPQQVPQINNVVNQKPIDVMNETSSNQPGSFTLVNKGGGITLPLDQNMQPGMFGLN